MDALFDRPTAGGTPGFGFSDQLAAASGVATGRSQDLEVLDSATDFRTGPVGVPPKHGHIKDPTLYINITHIPTKHSISLEGWVSQFSDQFQSTWSGTPVNALRSFFRSINGIKKLSQPVEFMLVVRSFGAIRGHYIKLNANFSTGALESI